MKLKITKELLELTTEKDMTYECIEKCIDTFLKMQNAISLPTQTTSTYINQKENIALLNSATDNDVCIRERLPNSFEEDKNLVNIEEYDTKQPSVRQYKNFRCPSCGQASFIKTLGELQTYCFRETFIVADNKKENKVLLINTGHMIRVVKKWDEIITGPEEPNTTLFEIFKNSLNVSDELYSHNAIEDTEVAITTDGNLECECPNCNERSNFDKWYDAYTNTPKYFEYDPCRFCGDETLTVIQQNKEVYKCDNQSCNHVYENILK